MQDKPTHKPENAGTVFGANPLRYLSAEQFAALGLESVVFSRLIDGAALVRLLPDANIDGEGGPFILVMSADGRPILVTDSQDSLEAWLEDQPVSLAEVH